MRPENILFTGASVCAHFSARKFYEQGQLRGYAPRHHQSVGFRAQELCESRGGRPWLPVPNSAYGLCGREATLNLIERVRDSSTLKRGLALN